MTRMTRHWFAFSILLLAATAAPGTADAQAPALAGDTRPNLRVLKTLPESQLFILMNLVADSLRDRAYRGP